MKLLNVLMILFMLFILQIAIVAQTSVGVYEAFWTASDETIVTSYHLYYEERSTPTGFVLQDGLDPSVINIDAYHVTEIAAVGLNQYVYELVLNNDEKWVKVGVVAQNILGQIGLLGSHPTPVQKQGTPIPAPAGVGFRLKMP